jgi:hypothetical protein
LLSPNVTNDRGFQPVHRELSIDLGEFLGASRLIS